MTWCGSRTGNTDTAWTRWTRRSSSHDRSRCWSASSRTFSCADRRRSCHCTTADGCTGETRHAPPLVHHLCFRGLTCVCVSGARVCVCGARTGPRPRFWVWMRMAFCRWIRGIRASCPCSRTETPSTCWGTSWWSRAAEVVLLSHRLIRFHLAETSFSLSGSFRDDVCALRWCFLQNNVHQWIVHIYSVNRSWPDHIQCDGRTTPFLLYMAFNMSNILSFRVWK